MRIDDRLLGALFCLLGIAVLWHSAGFPQVAKQHYGPAMFPTIIGWGFVATGIVLAVAAVRRSAAADRLLAFDDWRSGAGVARVALMLASILGFIVLGDRIGFPIIAFATLLLLYLAARRPVLRSIAIALGVTACLDLLFAKLLRVPLPRGLLGDIQWW